MAGCYGEQRPREGWHVSLAQIQSLTPEETRRLEALRIASAGELLSMSKTADSRRRLAAYMGMSRVEFEDLLAGVWSELEPVHREVGHSAPVALQDWLESSPPQNAEGKAGTDMQPTPLKALRPQPLSAQQLKSLRKLDVTTAEELVALGARGSNRQRLAAYLALSPEEFDGLLARVRLQLDPGVAADMERPERGGHRHGVLDSVPEARRRGRWPTFADGDE